MKKLILFLLVLTFIAEVVSVKTLNAASLSSRLKGRILLQVESKGEAWYLNPSDEKRHFLGRPADAFQVMRNLGLGISNKDFDSFNGYAPTRLSGMILLKVEDKGKAYYVNPIDLKIHSLGRPADAFGVMRKLGLGIKNSDLEKITMTMRVSEAENSEKGEPTNVYNQYLQALKDFDIDKLNKLSVDKLGLPGSINENEKRKAIEMILAFQAVNIEIANEIIEGDRAILKVQGCVNPLSGVNPKAQNNPSYGIIALKKIDSKWVLFQEKWESPVPVIAVPDEGHIEFWDVQHFCNNQKDVKACEVIEDDFKQSMCYSCFAELNADKSLCAKASPGYDQDKCYLDVAKITGDKELCGKISNDYSYKSFCEKSLELSDYLKDTNIYTIDSDNDGLFDGMEVSFYSNINNPDTDYDGYLDGEEVQAHFSPTKK